MSQHVEIIARGVFIHQSKVLLCQNRQHGHIFLPGGHIDFGEPAAVALEREIREELGIELVAGDFLCACEAIFDQPNKLGKAKRHHEMNLVFRLNRPAGSAFAGSDADQLTSQEQHIQFIWMPVQAAVDPSQNSILPVGIAQMIREEPSVPQWLAATDVK